MRSSVHRLSIDAVRAEAIFVSALQPSDSYDMNKINELIVRAVREFGSRGCAGRVAQEFGDHPETAVVRMRWARRVVFESFREDRITNLRPRTPKRSAALAHAGRAA